MKYDTLTSGRYVLIIIILLMYIYIGVLGPGMLGIVFSIVEQLCIINIVHRFTVWPKKVHILCVCEL